jgi:hypothetical protein
LILLPPRRCPILVGFHELDPSHSPDVSRSRGGGSVVVLRCYLELLFHRHGPVWLRQRHGPEIRIDPENRICRYIGRILRRVTLLTRRANLAQKRRRKNREKGPLYSSPTRIDRVPDATRVALGLSLNPLRTEVMFRCVTNLTMRLPRRPRHPSRLRREPRRSRSLPALDKRSGALYFSCQK